MRRKCRCRRSSEFRWNGRRLAAAWPASRTARREARPQARSPRRRRLRSGSCASKHCPMPASRLLAVALRARSLGLRSFAPHRASAACVTICAGCAPKVFRPPGPRERQVLVPRGIAVNGRLGRGFEAATLFEIAQGSMGQPLLQLGPRRSGFPPRPPFCLRSGSYL